MKYKRAIVIVLLLCVVGLFGFCVVSGVVWLWALKPPPVRMPVNSKPPPVEPDEPVPMEGPPQDPAAPVKGGVPIRDR